MADDPAAELEVDAAEVRVPTPWQRLAAWLGPPRDYRLTRWLVLRLLGVVYVASFAGILAQGLPHPPLTFLWTVQEEVGLHGARYLRAGLLGKPRLAFGAVQAIRARSAR